MRNTIDFRHTMIPAGYKKFQSSRYHSKFYRARITVGVPARPFLLKHKLPSASLAENWSKRLIERFKRGL